MISYLITVKLRNVEFWSRRIYSIDFYSLLIRSLRKEKKIDYPKVYPFMFRKWR